MAAVAEGRWSADVAECKAASVVAANGDAAAAAAVAAVVVVVGVVVLIDGDPSPEIVQEVSHLLDIKE